jgi:putative redox protein
MPEARVVWQEGLRFEAHAPGGHTIIIDSGLGENAGPGPMALVLVSLAGCTAMDVMYVMRKQRQPVTGLEVVITAERAEDHPRVYTGYNLTYIVHGEGVDRKAVERAVMLSEEKYCSVGAMLGQAAPIRHEIRLEV